MVVAIAGSLFLGLRDLGNERLRCEQQGRDAGSVLQGRSHDLGRINHTSTHQIAILLFVGVVTVVLALHLPNSIDHHRAIHASIGSNRLERVSQGILDDRGPELFVAL